MRAIEAGEPPSRFEASSTYGGGGLAFWLEIAMMEDIYS
jgi:hypothetical protein